MLGALELASVLVTFCIVAAQGAGLHTTPRHVTFEQSTDVSRYRRVREDAACALCPPPACTLSSAFDRRYATPATRVLQLAYSYQLPDGATAFVRLCFRRYPKLRQPWIHICRHERSCSALRRGTCRKQRHPRARDEPSRGTSDQSQQRQPASSRSPSMRARTAATSAGVMMRSQQAEPAVEQPGTRRRCAGREAACARCSRIWRPRVGTSPKWRLFEQHTVISAVRRTDMPAALSCVIHYVCKLRYTRLHGARTLPTVAMRRHASAQLRLWTRLEL